MKKTILFYILLILLFRTVIFSQYKFETNSFSMVINNNGDVVSFYDLLHRTEYLAKEKDSHFLTIKINGKYEKPVSAFYNQKDNILIFTYTDSKVHVKVKEKESHIVFEVIKADPEISLVIWGPYPTTINKITGEIIGVVRNDIYALGIQVLNVKTLGGYPLNDEGFDGSRSQTAKKTEWGSYLQAFCMDRTKPKKITVWGENFPDMPVPPMNNETVVGSKIAFFGCKEKDVLDIIEKIELAEGLPHPMIDGVWVKKSPETGRSYLIADFSEDDIDELLDFTKRANLRTLYHMVAFESWGHYELSKRFFPNGVQGLRTCVEKAKKMGILVGAHTLTNFINTNDPYITPVPDSRLAKTGTSILSKDISESSSEIQVLSPKYFDNEKSNWMHTIIIDKELIRYKNITPAGLLLDCQRGAFGTKAEKHPAGSEVGKLLDHPYKVFYPNIEMQSEIAKNLAKIFNEAGLSQMDFDGHEGCLASGQGDYALELFAKTFYDNLDHYVLNGTSNSEPFYWHINTYCNWGEPWYGGFNQSMQEYRINNQGLFERNFLPNMLGWYLLTETTSPSEMEWMLARAAGYNAGFAMATNLDALRKNPDINSLINSIREWETARRSEAFSEKQKQELKNPKNEFHLNKISEGIWDLYPIHLSKEYKHGKILKQPGESTASEWEFVNQDNEQILQFILQLKGENGKIENLNFEIDNYLKVSIPVEIKVNESIISDADSNIRLYDEKGMQKNIIKIKLPKIEKGKHNISFDCIFSGTPEVLINFKTIGHPERVVK